MKKTILFFAAIGAIAMTACQKESLNENASGKAELTPATEKTFVAGYDDEFKTTLGNDNKTVTWATGDQIIVYSADGQCDTAIVAATDAGKSSVMIKVTVGDAPFFAVACRPKTKVKFDATTQQLSVNQVPQLSGAWNSNDALVASTDGDAFAFKHTTGYMHFSTSLNVACVHVYCALGNTPAKSSCFGTINAKFKTIGGTPTISIPESYDPGTKGSGNDGFGKLNDFAIYKTRSDYFFPIIPGTGKVISITLKTTDGEYYVARIPSIDIERGKIYELTNFDSHLTKQNLVFYESFDKYTGIGGNDFFWKNDYKAPKVEAATMDNSGWAITNCPQGGGWACVTLGDSNKAGSLTTPSLGVSGNATINFKLSGYNVGNDLKSKNVTLSVVGSGTLSQTTFNLGTKVGWTNYNVSLTGADEATKIKIAAGTASSNRFYLDEFRVFDDNESISGDAYVQVTEGNAGSDFSGKYLLVTCPGGQYKVIDKIISGSGSFTMAVDPISVKGMKIAATAELQAAEFELEPSGQTSGTFAGSYLVKYNGQYVENNNGKASFKFTADKASLSDYAYWKVSLKNGCIEILNIKSSTRAIAYFEYYDDGTTASIQPLNTSTSEYFKNNLYAYKYTPAN